MSAFMSAEQLRKLPKVELHRHIEGSVRFETIVDLARRHNLDLGVRSGAELVKKTKITQPMDSLEDVLAAFETTRTVLCCYDAIKRITFENVEDAFHDGVRLLELRFAPVFIASGRKLDFDEIFEGVLDGVTMGMERYDIQVGLIHIIPRGQDVDKHQASNDEFLRYRKSNHKNGWRLCGFDLADSETAAPFSDYVKLVDQARRAGVGITIHTGENTGASYVRKTIEEYGPRRIGHGIKSIEDWEVMEMLRERDIHLEINPTSNWLTRSVESIDSHPLAELYHAGISISINSDDPHLMDIDLVTEYDIAHRVLGLSGDELYALNRRALEHSFLEEELKRRTRERYFS
jgi:adenosine deaminase